MIDYSTLTVEQLQAMSDEEFAQLDPSLLPQSTGSSELTSDALTTSSSNEDGNQEIQVDQVNQPIEEEDNQATPEDTVFEDTQASAEQSVAPSVEESVEDVVPTNTPETQPSEAELFYQKVTAPFKASGKEFKLDSAEDVIALAQKGIDYNIKMNAIKPSLKMIKTLEANGITQEDLGILIDIHQRKPEAIARLVKDAEIDLYAVEDERIANYAPTHTTISDADFNFTEVTESLQGSPRFNDVIGFVQNAEPADQKYVYENPEMLRLLTAQAESGVFDIVANKVLQERALGRLQGLTTLQAYDAVGKAMYGAPEPTPTITKPVAVAPVAKPVQRPVATQQPNPARQAAAAPKGVKHAKQTSSLTPQDIWNMSDEEFNKIDPNFL